MQSNFEIKKTYAFFGRWLELQERCQVGRVQKQHFMTYEENGNVYFLVLVKINMRTELKVEYCEGYVEHMAKLYFPQNAPKTIGLFLLFYWSILHYLRFYAVVPALSTKSTL